jgi:hypothetical protein
VYVFLQDVSAPRGLRFGGYSLLDLRIKLMDVDTVSLVRIFSRFNDPDVGARVSFTIVDGHLTEFVVICKSLEFGVRWALFNVERYRKSLKRILAYKFIVSLHVIK